MKRLFLLTFCCLVTAFIANAQKFSLIDMEYIMENIPAYQQANEELNIASQQYQKAIEAKAKEAETLYKAYQKASNSLSATQRTQKEEAERKAAMEEAVLKKEQKVQAAIARKESEARSLTPQQYRWLMEGLSVDQPKAHRPVNGLEIV